MQQRIGRLDVFAAGHRHRRQRTVAEQRAAVRGEVADQVLLFDELLADDRAARGTDGRGVVVALDPRRGAAVEQRSGAAARVARSGPDRGLLTSPDEQHLLDVALGERALAAGDLDDGGAVLGAARGRIERVDG